MHDLFDHFHLELLARALERPQRLMTIGVVRRKECDPLSLRLRKHMLSDRHRRHVWCKPLMESKAAEGTGFVDGVRLADRDEDHAAALAYLVDSQLHIACQRAYNEMYLVLLDQ